MMRPRNPDILWKSMIDHLKECNPVCLYNMLKKSDLYSNVCPLESCMKKFPSRYEMVEHSILSGHCLETHKSHRKLINDIQNLKIEMTMDTAIKSKNISNIMSSKYDGKPILKKAYDCGSMVVFCFVLKNKKFNISDQHKTLTAAVKDNNVEAVEEMLRSPRIDTTITISVSKKNYAYKIFSEAMNIRTSYDDFEEFLPQVPKYVDKKYKYPKFTLKKRPLTYEEINAHEIIHENVARKSDHFKNDKGEFAWSVDRFLDHYEEQIVFDKNPTKMVMREIPEIELENFINASKTNDIYPTLKYGHKCRWTDNTAFKIMAFIKSTDLEMVIGTIHTSSKSKTLKNKSISCATGETTWTTGNDCHIPCCSNDDKKDIKILRSKFAKKNSKLKRSIQNKLVECSEIGGEFDHEYIDDYYYGYDEYIDDYGYDEYFDYNDDYCWLT
jgi:hypothetical protein